MLNSFDSGGTERQMTELICRLDRRRFAVRAACLADRGTLRDRVLASGTPVSEFRLQSLKSPRTWKAMRAFASWCKEHHVQVVHACDFYANVFALPAAALAGVSVRIGSRRDVSMPERSRAHHALQHVSYRFAHRVVANSSAAAQQLLREGIPQDKVGTIPNGLDVDRFGAQAAIRRATSGLRPLRTVTTVANLRPGKGHEVLLAAVAQLATRHPDLRFRFVGDGPLRRDLERQAAALGVSEHVEFLGERDDVPAILAKSDIFAFPSHMEASPNAVIEAMAAGLPIVASRVGGIPELIDDGRTGVLVAPADAQALAAAIERLLGRPDLAAVIGAAARDAATAQYSFDRMVSAFERLYTEEVAARVAPEALTWAASSGN